MEIRGKKCMTRRTEKMVQKEQTREHLTEIGVLERYFEMRTEREAEKNKWKQCKQDNKLLR